MLESNKHSLRYQQLCDEIENHNLRYYRDDSPVVSDHDYDRLMSDLLELEKLYPELITPNSPSQRVGSAPLDAVSYTHLTLPTKA